MVSVDRNTLISQIVSLNPQLKPDELHELSDAQLQAKLSQCIAGNKQDKNVDSVRINNSSSEASKTPKMTTEEAQDNAIENIESNAEQAQKLLDAQDDGDISKAYNFVKEKLNSELAKSNVAKVVHKQFETAEFLREAKQGTLTYKEYLRRKREDIFKTFPEIDNYNDKQKQMIKQGLDSLTEGQLNRLQNQLLALPKKDDKNYQNSVNSFKQNFFEESTVEKTTTTRIGEVSKTSKSREIKKAYNPSDGDRLMTFEETYLLEQGVEFNKENIQKFNDSTAQYTFANSLTNKRNEIHSLLTSALEKAKVQGSTGLSSVDLINAELIPSIGASITKLYGKDNLAKGLKDLTNGQYSLNDEIKSLEDLSRKDVSAMNNIAKLILTKIDENYSKALNGKKLEDYAKTMANDYKNAFGTKDASALASSFAQDQEGIVQTARNTVQIAGMVVMVGGMAFCPPAALGGGLISSFGGIGVEAYNENTKENPDEEKNKELGQEALVNAALFAIGAGSGKVGSMAKTALTAKNAPKLVAAMADIGVDSSLSLLGDLTLTGQIDLSGEGFSQLMSLVAGHKGKIVKGVQKGKQVLKEKFSAQANTKNKILQMPDGTVVEVKPDGSTVVKDTPQGMLDVEKQELITKASRENPANRVEEKVREEWQKTDIETTAPDENVDLFNLDTEAGLKTSTPEIKNETTSLILNGKLNENLTKRYDEMGRVFTEIAQRRSADIQKLADQYPNDKQKVADGICKILSEEFGMQGYEPPIVLKDTQGADGGADWPNGRIIINKEITNLKQLTTMISHEYIHMLQFRDIVVQYGEQGVKDLINNDKSIPQDKKEQAINAALNNPYNKHLIASYNAQKAQSGSIDYYVRRIYKDEFTNTIGTDDMEGYTNQVAEREAYYGGSEHIGNKTTSLDQTNIGMAPADGAMAALRARMKAQLMKGKQTHNDVEVKTKKQEPSTQFEIDGDGNAHFKETPAGKLGADSEIKTYTQEEVDKLIAQDPEHIKVMTNGKILRITDNFEFVHIGNIAKSNGIKVLDSKAFDKKISNMRNEYNDTHRFTEDDRQKLNELYNNAKTDEEKQFLLQVIDAKLFTGDYQFNAKAISELQGNYSTEAKAIYEAMANIQSKQYSKIYYNQDFVDLMNLSKSVDKDIIIELINAKNVDNTPRFNGQNIQKWVELGQKTDKTEFLDMLHATDNNGAPKYNYSQIEEKIALKNPMAKSLLTKAQNLIKNNKKIKEIKDKLIENIMNETPETVNKQFKMINLLNDNALKIFLENYGLKNLNIDKQTVDAINSAHPKVLQVILKDGADDPSISLLLRDFENIPTKLLDSITDENKFFNLLALVHSKSLGFIDIYNNTKPETLNRIPQNVKLELAQMGHVYTNETHISSALDFIKTPKYQELKTTLFEKFDSKFDAEDFDSKLQAYLIANKTGNPDDFINYVKSQDFNNLTSIAPRIKEFEPEQLFEFFNYHKSQGTKLTPENLTYKGNLTHTLETNMTDYQQLSQILSRYPNTDRRVGHLPKEWINDIPKSEQKDFVANIYQAFSNFASIPKDERNVNNLATTLKSIFKKDVKVEQLGYGSFGSGYKISIENSKPFVLKAFNNIDDDLKYMKNIHGRSIEPQNALYSKGKGNDFAGFYFGKVNDVIDKDGFMLNEFLPDKPSKSQQKDLTISRFDSSDVDRDYGHNFQYGKILDYGAMETTDKRLMENGNVAKLTRIISSNMIASKNSNVYGFNDTRLAIVKKAIDKIGNPKDTIDALSIVEKYATKEIDKNSLDELKALKKDAAFKWLEKNKPDIENKEAYFAAYELNDKITQIENSIINAFKDTGLDKGLRFSNRAKSVQSIYDKINSNMKKGKSLEASIQKVQDGYGVRTIMDDFNYKQYPEIVEMYKKDPEQAYRMAAKKQSEHIIKNLEKLIEKQLTNGDFSMVTISNYKGKNGLPYLSTEQINELCEFAKQKGITLDVKIDETGSMENIKGSGYTALQMNLKYKDGTVIEWQTRGQDVDNFAEAEHVMYDSRQEKDITGGREQLKELYAPYEKAAQDMETEDFADYMDYLTNYYKQLRLKELGFPVIFPKLPAKFGTNPDISAEGLLKLHDEKERILKAA